MKFPKDHPLSEFNQYLYLDSGDCGVTNNMPIYIFKKDNFGILVELHIPSKSLRKVNMPKATIFKVIFNSEYDWRLGKKTVIFEDQTIDGLNLKIANYMKGRFNGK